MALDYFIAANREEIIARCRAKVATRSRPPPRETTTDHGVPLFLDQLLDALRRGMTSNPAIGRTALHHGHDLLRKGFTCRRSFTTMGTCVNPSPTWRWRRTRRSVRLISAR